MVRKIQVVIGANYGDEGKGLVSGSLAREAMVKGEKTLTVFYNGTSQRAHTFCKEAFHSIAGGSLFGSDTFYHPCFVVDPISLWISGGSPVISPKCRVILPCDVISNRKKERERGKDRHGSCGFGLFEAVRRNKDEEYAFQMSDVMDSSEYALYHTLMKIEKKYGPFDDELYNMDNLMRALELIRRTIKTAELDDIKDDYDRIIFEGGQGLALDQGNKEDFPYLTPSSTGSTNILRDITEDKYGVSVEVFYVTRSYMTRHGAGPMECECLKKDICPDIVDRTNQPNEFQGSLRFGKINLASMNRRIERDLDLYKNRHAAYRKANLVVTQTNYTSGKIFTVNGLQEIRKPDWADHLYLSDQEDYMEKCL